MSDIEGSGVSRRRFLGVLGAAGAGLAVGVGATAVAEGGRAAEVTVPFDGEHQSGIATAPQRFLHFAAFDVQSDNRAEAVGLLQNWSRAARRMCAGQTPADSSDSSDGAGGPPDSGEVVGLGPQRLTITFGFGPSFFSRPGVDRFGIAGRQPATLRDLPAFANDALDASVSGGDVCVQACADHPQVAFHAVRSLLHLAGSLAVLRWSQRGFEPTAVTSTRDETPRNLFGQKDGTNNLKVEDPTFSDHVWVGANEEPSWMHGGSYLVARRIRMVFDTWDRTPLEVQESVLGRSKASGAPLGEHSEFDPVDLDAKGAAGTPVIPVDAHIRLASPDTNDGIRILRRGYSFDDGVDNLNKIDAGLFFIAFQRDIASFSALQQKLSRNDAMHRFLRHTNSAVFACPPGALPNGYVGQTLFE